MKNLKINILLTCMALFLIKPLKATIIKSTNFSLPQNTLFVKHLKGHMRVITHTKNLSEMHMSPAGFESKYYKSTSKRTGALEKIWNSNLKLVFRLNRTFNLQITYN